MKRVAALALTSLVMGLFLIPAPAVSAPPFTIVNCNSPSASIQNAVDSASGPTTIRFLGKCVEVVTITKDDITLDGHDMGTVEGTITFDGAQRGVVQNATVTGPGSGIVADHGASVLIQDNTITANGDALDIYSPGVQVKNGSSAQIRDNTITDNTSDGVGVFNGAFALIKTNTIERNGRASPFFEAGIQVSRAVVRGQGNIIRNNDYAGVEVFNFGSYRTGSFITAVGQIDNDGPFEIIDVGATGDVAAEIAQMSYLDLRQVLVTGNVFVGRKSMVQLRGDGIPIVNCSLLDGDLTVTATQALARLRSHVHVTGTISGTVDGASEPIGNCPNLP